MTISDPDAMRKVVREVAAEVAKQKVADDETLLSSGLIDSLSVLKLISKLEQRLQIRIPNEKVQPDDFDSVDLMMETIERVAAG